MSETRGHNVAPRPYAAAERRGRAVDEPENPTSTAETPTHTVVHEPLPASGPTPDAPGAGWLRAVAGWVPPALVTAFAVVTMVVYGVPAFDVLRFAGYVVAGIVLPGTLLWRALRGGPGLLVADVAGGTAFGYALEVGLYIGARAVGVPLLVPAVQAAVLIAFLAVPGLRRHWRGSGQRVPIWWSALVSTFFSIFVVALSAVTFFRQQGLTWPYNSNPYVDLPFHLALAGEVKNHVPPMIPYVRGESLYYHWFVYADLAATSHATGVELQTLLYRLAPLPTSALLPVLIGMITYQLSRRWLSSLAAVVLLYVATVPSPFPALDSPIADGSFLGTAWISPTQTFGAILFAPAVLLLCELVGGARRPEGRGGRADAGRWVVVGVLLLAVAGGKATFLPMLLAALLLVVAVGLVFRRRLNRPALIGLALTAVAFLFAQFVLFQGNSAGLTVRPLETVRRMPLGPLTGLVGPDAKHPTAAVVVLLGVTLFCWACQWSGLFGLAAARRRRADGGVHLCLGIGIAGLSASLLLDQPGLSQLYFYQSARPYLAVLAAVGLAALAGRLARWWRSVSLVLAAAAGAATLAAVREIDGQLPTLRTSSGSFVRLATALVEPFGVWLLFAIVLIGLMITHALVTRHTRPPRPTGRRRVHLGRLALATLLVFTMAGALPKLPAWLLPPVQAAAEGSWRHQSPSAAEARSGPFLPAGGLTAGRWLRDHSGPDDLIATNAHCRLHIGAQCDSRHFWVSGYTERRVLVEGWGYTASAIKVADATGAWLTTVPFWKPQMLADNDAVFTSPSPANVARLRDAYGVRWLFVLRTNKPAPSPALDAVATLRYTSGDCAVYQLR